MATEDIHKQIEVNCRLLNDLVVKNSTGENYCPAHLDIYKFCWQLSPPNTTIQRPCPRNESLMATGKCQPDGSWTFDWSNCSDSNTDSQLQFYNNINKLYIIGYGISLVALIISLIIFLVFRSLRCTRIRLHIHLFISFILNNIFWIIWYVEVIWNGEVILLNPIWCQALFILTNAYVMLTNYMWMFCEALYLHLSLVVVFVKDEVAMRYFIAIGWGLPVIITTVYACVKIFVLNTTDYCWLKGQYGNWSQWILSVPVGISLIASLIFLINVLRVILNVMHPRQTDPTMAGIKRAARAAIILIPLFGLHYLVLAFRPTTEPYTRIYDYISVALIAPQGFCVSCLFCFANHDVHQAIKAFLHRQLHTSRWSNYYYTGTNPADSAGVYVINSHSQSNNFALI